IMSSEIRPEWYEAARGGAGGEAVEQSRRRSATGSPSKAVGEAKEQAQRRAARRVRTRAASNARRRAPLRAQPRIAAEPDFASGMVYVMTNSAESNEVIALHRAGDGTLTPV